MLFVQRIRNSWRNKKPPTHQGGGFNPPAEIYLVGFPTTHRRELSSPIKGTLALPLPGCQTPLEVVPDVGSDGNGLASGCNKILCHSKPSGSPFRTKTILRIPYAPLPIEGSRVAK